MSVPVLIFEFSWVFSSFLVLECMVGMFNSCGATLRSRYYPESIQSSIISVFRFPLNLLVVIGTKLTDKADDIPSLQFVFGILSCMHFAAMFLQVILQVYKSNSYSKSSENSTIDQNIHINSDSSNNSSNDKKKQ